MSQCQDGKPAQMIAACTALINSGQETQQGLAVAHSQIGYALDAELKYEPAVNEYNIAIALDPGDAVTYVRRGLANNGSCHLDAAIADDSRALSMLPTNSIAYFNRGLVWLREGNVAKARADFVRANQLTPNHYPTPDQAISAPRPPPCAG